MNYRTKDVQFAGFLVFSGLSLLCKERENGKDIYVFREEVASNVANEIAQTIKQLKIIKPL